MTEVRLIGMGHIDLLPILMEHEVSRNALSPYDLTIPFENSIDLTTISIGAAVSLLNDLNWYLSRYVEEALIREPSIHKKEWISRKLAVAIRNEKIRPRNSNKFLKIYSTISSDNTLKLTQPAFLTREQLATTKSTHQVSESSFYIRLLATEFPEKFLSQ